MVNFKIGDLVKRRKDFCEGAFQYCQRVIFKIINIDMYGDLRIESTDINQTPFFEKDIRESVWSPSKFYHRNEADECSAVMRSIDSIDFAGLSHSELMALESRFEEEWERRAISK